MAKKIGVIEFLENHAWLMQQCFRLTHWKINIFDKIKPEFAKDWEGAKKEWTMCTLIIEDYIRSEILVLNDAKRDYKRGIRYQLIESLCHEIVHIFTHKIRNSKEREQTTEHLSRLLMTSYDLWMDKNNVNYKTGLISNKK